MKPTVAITAFVLAILCYSPASIKKLEGQPQRGGTVDPARQDAFALAQGVVRSPLGPSGRLPEFLTWSTRAEISCSGTRDRSSQTRIARVDPRPQMHAFPAAGNGDRPADFGDLGFYYDLAAENRLCGPVIAGDQSTPVIFKGQVISWWNKLSIKPSAISPFASDTRMAATFWNVIPRPADAGPVSVTVNLRSDKDAKSSTTITINIPKAALAQPPACPSLHPQPRTPAGPAAQPMPDLNDFYWIQIGPDDKTSQGSCGDFLYLGGFHVIQKKADEKWLWSTFWWDPNAPDVFSTRSLGQLVGAGPNPAAWQNYAMDAAYGTAKNIFNPWKEDTGSNCEFCHRTAVIPRVSEVSGRGTPKPFSVPALYFDGIFAGSNHQQ